jgi:amino acid adenylation domain-containing protein
MEIKEILSELSTSNIKLDLQDGNIDIMIPKGGKLPDHLLAAIKNRKAELITFIKSTGHRYSGIKKAETKAHYPLSSSQKRLWLLSQMEESSMAYHMPLAFKFEGELDRDAFEKAIQTIVGRHESLRTVFSTNEEAEVFQTILPKEETRFVLNCTDLYFDESQEALLQSEIRKELERPFDIQHGPLLRGKLIRLTGESSLFIFNMHHIISDAWSMEVFIRELLLLYQTYKSGKRNSLPELPIQYKDYAVWQQHELNAGKLEMDKTYWIEQFQDAIPILELPTQFKRPHLKSFSGGVLQHQLSSETTAKLLAFVSAKGGTLFMGLMAGLKALLFRYTAQDDLIVGSPVSGRDHPDLENQIGFYINTLAFRTRFKSEESTFASLFNLVKANVLGGFEHQSYPFDQLVDELNPLRDLGRSPLFDVMMVLQNAEVKSFDLRHSVMEGLKVSSFSLQGVTSKFDLTLNFIENDGQVTFAAEYNSDLFTEAFINQFCVHFESILHQMLQDPDQLLRKIIFLDEAEQQYQLEQLSPLPQMATTTTLIEAFAEQVIALPQKTAIYCEGRKMSYLQLEIASNQFAHYLHKKYVLNPEDLIGVNMERSEWMLVILLGILKSGGAYLPIDPDYPKELVRFITDDSQCKVVVDKQVLEEFLDQLETLVSEPPNVALSPGNLAYVIYTSGTTGKPKGVLVEHKGIIRLVKDPNYVQLSHASKLLVTGSPSFDSVTFEYWSMLLNGGSLVLAPKEDLLRASTMKSLIQTHDVNMMWLTASWFNEIVSEDLRVFEKLQTLLIGGDKLSPTHVNLLRNTFEQLKVINGYGPTENTTFSLCHEITESNAFDIPIGKPVSQSTVYITDKDLNLVPLGVEGEILLGGEGLARGYLNQDGLTAEKFINNPFLEGERLYHTGDKGKWTPEGLVHFAGRMDEQVKIRGYRIEPGEIENALMGYDQINQAVVTIYQDKTDKAIAAYYVAEEEVDLQALRNYLRSRLPNFMIPSSLIRLPVLPLTGNGKINRAALPAPDATMRDIPYEAPKTELEVKLAGLWARVLDQVLIGLYDDFFALGGHSLRATRLLTLYEKELGVKLNMKQLFQHPSLEAQAKLISEVEKTVYFEIPAAPKQHAYRLSSAQERLFFLHEFEPGSTAYNIPLVHFLGKSVDKQKLELAWNAIIQRHESLRTSFQKLDGETYQSIHENLKVELQEHVCSPAELGSYIRNFVEPFDLSQAPLLRSSLVEVRDSGYFWIVDIHHIVADGTSIEVLTEDFLRLYNGETLPPLSLQYRDFSEWQNGLSQSGKIDMQRNYWKSQFLDKIPTMNLPADRTRPAIFNFQGAIFDFSLNKEKSAQLHSLSLRQGGTLQISLLAILNILFYKYTGEEDFVIGCSVAGRRHSDLERVIGMFVNSLAMRNSPKGDMQFSDFYSEVKAVSLAGYENQDVQFEELVSLLNVSRDPSRNPIFDVSLVVQNFERAEQMLGKSLQDAFGGEDQELKVDSNWSTSKFDMTWFASEVDDQIHFNIEYYSAIFDPSSIARFAAHFEHIVDAVIENQQVRLADINLLSETEQEATVSKYIHGEKIEYPFQSSVHTLFEEQAALKPLHSAILDGEESLTYQDLDEKANGLSRFLKSDLTVETGTRIGILLHRSKDLLVSILGILKAGAAYVPLDKDYPEERLLQMIEDAGIETLIAEKSLVEYANRLQWRSKALKNVMLIDSDNYHQERGGLQNELMSQELWDHVGETSSGTIDGGGWMSSFTGENFSEQEMTEYRENVYLKLKKYLKPDMKVLEIGCSSGITMFRIAPEVALYHGTDLSSSILEKTKQEASRRGLTNIRLTQLPAHEVDSLEAGEYDLVIINSVIHCFEGHNYLRDVLLKVTRRLKDHAILFLGDLMDEDRRKSLIDDLVSFKQKNTQVGFRTKIDWSAELFISRAYLEQFVSDIKIAEKIEFSDKIHSVSNELTLYRYDAIVQIDKTREAHFGKKTKFQYDLRNLSGQATTPLSLKLPADALAYILFTSGSTGKPKGVMVHHRAIVNYITACLRTYTLEHNSEIQVGLFTSLSFDLTVTSLFLPLLSGGRIRMYDPELEISDLLRRYLHSDSEESHIKLTPAHIRLIEELNLEKTLVGLAIVGGEELQKNQIRTLRNLNPDMRIFNEYGPTEATVGCIVWEVKNSEEHVLIGKPIANTSAYILDAGRRLVPVGVLGEIYIGGDGLALGYWGSPELTREKFVSNPFVKNERIYRTGDLGRWLPNGDIEFLGRKDDQVKIRGFRLELGEVTRALLDIDIVKDAVVVLREREEKELVGYVVLAENSDSTFLRESLKTRIPEYMIPSVFVQMDALPLTVNGKINKRALPDPQEGKLKGGGEIVAPRNPTEERLTVIWKQALGIEQVGVSTNFFELGGHSLKATKLIGIYEKEFQVKLSLKIFFENTTIEKQAQIIQNTSKTRFVKIERAPERAYYDLSSAQKRIYFMNELAVDKTSYNMPVMEFLGEEADALKIENTLLQLINRHESLRTSFVKKEERIYQQIHNTVDFRLETHTCELNNFQSYVKEFIRPFDLAQAPLVRASLVYVAKTGYALLVDEHHIISDGVSHQLLVRDFLSVYNGGNLKPLSLQYKDFSEWQNSLMENGELDRQKKYWAHQFEDTIPKLEIPADKSRPPAFTFEGGRIGFEVSRNMTSRLHELGKKLNGTLQITLLSVLNTLLYKYTGQNDLVVGCGVAGRRHPDLENIYGMFVNSLAIRNFPQEQKTFRDFYQEVRNSCLEAYDNQDLQFDELIDVLKIERDQSRNPLFDVLLVVQNFDIAERTSTPETPPSPELSSEAQSLLQVTNNTAKFDLTFHVWQRAEDIYISVEYYKGIFEEETISRLLSHFMQVIREVLANPDIRLSDIQITPIEEQNHILNNLVDGKAVFYDPPSTIHAHFTAQSHLSPQLVAVKDEFGSLTYEDLELRSNQLANYLHYGLSIQSESRIGILQRRNANLIVSYLGVLKAASAYLPLDGDFPIERLLYMIEDASAEILLTEKSLVGLANTLLWRSKTLKHIVCIDSEDVLSEVNGISNELMQKDLWDHVGEKAVDAITAGGWLSSYTGEPISEEEMKEYSDNAFLKLEPYLQPEMKVLEIGCSSGLTLFRVAPKVQSYYGTDLSSTILDRTRNEAMQRGQSNVVLSCLPAHEINQLGETGFDLIIINSVIQCFESHNYLRDILTKAVALLKPEGLLFLGDLMDEDKREELVADLRKFKINNPNKQYKTKTDWSAELFVSRNYLSDLLADGVGISKAVYSEKMYTIPNELSLFRYDALLFIDKRAASPEWKRTKQQSDLQSIRCYDTRAELAVDSDEKNTCYVMYTSGSTGNPKGVLIPHRGVIRLVKKAEYVEFSTETCLLATGAITFDASTLEFWGPLLNGGKLILAEKKTLLDPFLLKELIQNEHINTMWFTAGWLNELVDTDIELFSPLRYLLAGGDKLSVRHIRKLKEKFPELMVINGYGPTENTTFSLTYRIENTFGESFPIGKPLNNSSAWIVDKQNRLMPVGVVGEIALGGDGLAISYLNRDRDQPDKFVDNPYRKGEKLYRSGDLGRWRVDGNIEFMGRRDDQVKIRGYRIELGEIEACILSLPFVRNVSVMTDPEHPKQLIAFVLSADIALNVASISKELEDLLPEYMVPSKIILLDSFPLNANGKVDKKHLLKWEGALPKAQHIKDSKLSRLEEEIRDVWKEVLNLHQVSVEDDFFKIGGHSLKAISLISAYLKKFGTRLSLNEVFDKKTIAEHALLIGSTPKQLFEEIPLAPEEESYPITGAQKRLWELGVHPDGSRAWNMPFSKELRGNYNLKYFKQALHSLIKRHDALRTVFRKDKSAELRQWIHPPDSGQFQVIEMDLRHSDKREQEASRFIEQDSFKAFDLEHGPLFRAFLIRMEEDVVLFYFNIHHIISDGLSLEIMTREVMQVYNALESGEEITLSRLPFQFKDYTLWQLSRLRDHSLDKHKAYWLDRFRKKIPVLSLPFENERPPMRTYNGRLLGSYIPAPLTQKLRNYCFERKGSLFMGLLASMNVLFYKYSGQRDLVMGVPTAGREHKDLENQIGFYINTLAIRNELDETQDFNQFFVEVRNNVLDGFSHQAFPYDDLAEELVLAADHSRNLLFDVMIALVNVGDVQISSSVPEDQRNKITDYGPSLCLFDVDISFQEVEDYLAITLEYNTDLYDGQYMAEFLEQYKQLLGLLLEKPEMVLEQVDVGLSVLTEE